MKEDAMDPRRLLEAGKTALNSGDYEGALRAFREVLEADRDNGQAHFEMGNLFLRKGDEATAAEEYEKALAIDPANDKALVELGKICARRKEPARAMELLGKALEINGENPSALLELGKLYRVSGDHARSRAAFEAARRAGPGNEALDRWLAYSDEVKEGRREHPPYRVFFTWGMNYECNYRCSYCHAPKPEQPDFDRRVKFKAACPGTRKVIEAWEAVAARYGSCRIRMDGGEPSLYPDFHEIVRALSRMHMLQINTNLSFDTERFCREIDPRRVRIDASFHSEYVSLEEFLARVKALRDAGFKVTVSFVAYPPLVGRIPGYKKAFREAGVTFFIHPYSGEYQGKQYPGAYTPDETATMYRSDGESRTELEWRAEKGGAQGSDEEALPPGHREVRAAPAPAKEEGNAGGSAVPPPEGRRACRMGQMYARIYPSGDVYRCCTDDGLLRLGNLYSGGFALLEDASPCEHKGCRCWRCMVIGEEQRWLSTWIDDWEMPF